MGLVIIIGYGRRHLHRSPRENRYSFSAHLITQLHCIECVGVLHFFYFTLNLFCFIGNCGGVLNIGPNSQQVITSPGYSDRRYYLSKQECTWWIKVNIITHSEIRYNF